LPAKNPEAAIIKIFSGLAICVWFRGQIFKTFQEDLWKTFQRKYPDFLNFFGKCLWKNLEDLPKKILGKDT